MGGACAVKTTCGQAVPGTVTTARTTATPMTTTADTVCAACADGTFAVGVGACTACTVVAESLADTVLTCTSDTDSRVVACASAKRKTVGVDAVPATTDPVVAATAGTADTCTTDCADGSFAASASLCTRCTSDTNAVTGTTYTCSADDNARFSACKDTFYKDISGKSDVCRAHDTCGQAVPGATTTARATTTAGTATANTVCAACAAGTYATGNGACGDCGTVTGALTAATYTCTSNADIRVSACAADKVKHAGVDASDGVTTTPDTCADSVGCGNNIAGTARTATTPKTTTADAVCPACVTGASETAGNCGCDAGTFKNTDSTACTACSPAAAPVANAIYTQCTDATAPTAFTCEAGFWKDGDKCTACTAITNAASITCTSATNSAVGMCNTGAEGNSVAAKCTACDAIANAAVTCTWPGNSQIATCNDKFELKSGACTAVVVPDAPATTTPAATPAATAATPSAANTATIGFAAAVFAAVASVAS